MRIIGDGVGRRISTRSVYSGLEDDVDTAAQVVCEGNVGVEELDGGEADEAAAADEDDEEVGAEDELVEDGGDEFDSERARLHNDCGAEVEEALDGASKEATNWLRKASKVDLAASLLPTGVIKMDIHCR